MNKTLMILIALFLNLFHPPVAWGMEPDEESLRNPKFVAEYNCLVDHFLIKKNFDSKKWGQALDIIKHLENIGYADRFLTVAKAKILMKQGMPDKSLELFQQALGETYKCKLTIPKFNFTQNPNLAREAIVWHYISQLYGLMGNLEQATATQTKAESLLKKSLGNEKDIDGIVTRVFVVFSLFQEPLAP